MSCIIFETESFAQHKEPAEQNIVKNEKGCGAAEGTRTPDPIITNDVLYHLSYSGHGAGFSTAPKLGKVLFCGFRLVVVHDLGLDDIRRNVAFWRFNLTNNQR